MDRIKRILIYFVIVLAIFLLVQKPIFFLYNHQFAGNYSISHLWNVYLHGFRLDLAATCYISALPLIMIVLSHFSRHFPLKKLWHGYNLIMALLIALITIGDAAMYEFWEFKLDATIFMYLDDPKNAAASVSIVYILMRVIAVLLLALGFWALMSIPVNGFTHSKRLPKMGQVISGTVAYILLLGLTFAGIRGLDKWPNTPGAAFFSNKSFYNHAALNPVFNMLYSCTRVKDYSKQFQYEDLDDCLAFINPYFPTQGKPTIQLLNTNRPNILVIALEGMGAVFIGALGGEKEVAPGLSSLCSQSVNFTHAYCSSFRTDRGIVALLSGYPGQPTTSIMRYTRKVQSLSGLPKILKNHGYKTQALYGGDVSFFNMSNYFYAVGHDTIISQNQFLAADRTTHWGVPDHTTFQWLLNDLQKKAKDTKNRYYTTHLTLSSHTPFDVPYHRLTDKKLNSFAYTDSCVTDFIHQLRKTPAWNNLLIVITADHGFNHRPVRSAEFPHVPMLMLGGAIKQPMQINTIMGQTDVPATVLGQLGIDHQELLFSRDVLADTYIRPCAFNTFGNGFNVFTPEGNTIFDTDANKVIEGHNAHREHMGKAFLQKLYDDLGHR